MSSSEADYSFVKHQSIEEEDVGLKKTQINSEISVNELSGDEAMEKSFAVGSLHSSMWRQKKANLFLSGITVMKSMVGVGILGLPNVAKNFGIIPMALLVLFVYGCTNFSTELLIKSKNMCRHSNYTTIGYSLFPTKTVIVIINLIIIFCNLGTCLGELIIFATTCENLVRVYDDREILPFYLQRWFFLISVGFIIVPLITVKQIERLKFVSLIAITSMVSFTTVIVYNFFTLLSNDELASDYRLFAKEFDFRQAFGSLPNIVLAFNWTFNQFPIYKGMINPNDARLKKSAWMGTSLGTLLYLIVGILGYMTYGSKVETNFLKTIQVDDIGKPLYIFLNVAFTLSTTLTLPLLFYGSRNNCISLLNQLKCSGNKKVKRTSAVEEASELPYRLSQEEKTDLFHKKKLKNKQQEEIKFYVTSIVLEVMLIIGAIYLTQLEIVFNLLGAIGSNAIATTMPSLFYFKCIDKFKDQSLLNTRQKQLYYIVKGFFLYSLILVVVCVGSEILRIARGEE